MTQRLSPGFTIPELLVVITVIGILASFVFIGISDSQARSRDNQRVTDIDTIRGKLETYYTDKGGYPNTLTVVTDLDPEALKDPNGEIISSSTVASQAAALSAANPTASIAHYVYFTYPTGCNAITCTGYVLKSYIERPSNAIPNPYIQRGNNNN
jgi:prepilin-type N-terminal cleavage/methylation domain-containing protein